MMTGRPHRESNTKHAALDQTGVHVETGPDWCIYVTNWTAALMGGYTWAALLAVLLPRVQWLDRAAWFLHSVAAPLTIMVTILYWA